MTKENSPIRTARKSKNLTLEEVAGKIGVTATTVSRWEREPRRVTVPVLENLAKVLEMDAKELLADVRGLNNNRGTNTVMVHGLTKSDHSNPFNAGYLQTLTNKPADQLAIVTVQGDAMEPTLKDGDQALIDLTHQTLDRAGLFVFQEGNAAGIRRVLPELGRGRVQIKPENPNYGDPEFVDPDAVKALGRVIWIGKKT
ncbi:XRE family transcriptional regulator [Terasakiella sp.]|uniref:XRE family transcriptional regulator n=1 Tax=Terasakiella sp. TaxID=2034861 RepID=UPI003AA90233